MCLDLGGSDFSLSKLLSDGRLLLVDGWTEFLLIL